MNFSELLIIYALLVCTFGAPRDEIVGQIFYRQELGLTEVPTDIPPNAGEVHLDSNSISHLATGVFSNLTQCTLLVLSVNTISSLEMGAFNDLSNLYKLDLGANKMKALEQGMFDGMPKLTVLLVSANDIHTVSSGCFRNLGNLEELYLSGNDLSTVNGNMWLGLNSLTRLDLQFNLQMQVIPSGGFSNLPKLDLLHLHNNWLKTFTRDIFTINDYPESNGHPPILRLTLGSNPLVCDKKLCWLKKGEIEGWLNYRVYYGTVSSPNCANDVEWNNLDLNCSQLGKVYALMK